MRNGRSTPSKDRGVGRPTGPAGLPGVGRLFVWGYEVEVPTVGQSNLLKILNRNKYLYLMMIPGLISVLVFHYFPMYGLVIAFKDYNPFIGIADSPWVGLDNFKTIFASGDFWQVLRNTLIISIYKLLVGFTAPILLALILNEVAHQKFKRAIQSVLYLPHFISWVTLGGIMLTIFAYNGGIVNTMITALGGHRVNIFADAAHFRWVLVWSDVWKGVGWGTIIYLSAITQVDTSLYEAAVVDGAKRWRLMWHITLPAIKSVVVLLLILRIGHLMSSDFEQILVLQNNLVRSVSDVFATYVYRVGLGQAQYSFATCVGIFESVVAIVLIVSANRVAKMLGEEGLY
jgi:putative aldouronate transport system permease protein